MPNPELTRWVESRKRKPVYPYPIKCRNCGNHDGMSKGTVNLNYLKCPRCKRVGTTIYLKTKKRED